MFFYYLRGFLRNFKLKMTSKSHVTIMPAIVRGMKQLDTDKFTNTITVTILNMSSTIVSKVLPICKPYMLKVVNNKPLQRVFDKDAPFDRYLYLHPEKVTCWNDIPEQDRLSLISHNITEANLDVKELKLSYENFKYEDIFNAVLPENMEKISGFSQIGHIIHLNLRSHLLEYKSIIGAVLLDKVKSCRTVVNKSDNIGNTYRNFNMEVLAGEEDFNVKVKESNCVFEFDFSKVYWNPRLAKEHGRVIDCLKAGDVLFDVFCGVGPYSVPAAKKGVHVFANDLNPDSYRWLKFNVKLNKLNKDLFKSYNLDGKIFICTIFKDFIKDRCKGSKDISPDNKIHVTMNLPGMAVEFLKHFNGLIDDKELADKFNSDIIVYIYCFAETNNRNELAKQMVIEKIGRDISSDILDVFCVRNVAPKKEMMKVTFKLTKEILFDIKTDQELDEPPLKKLCVDNGSAVCEKS